MLALECLFSEHDSPAITMLIDVISPQNRGFAVSAYFFCVSMSGTISTLLLGFLQHYFNAEQNTHLYGYILCAFIVFAYATSLPFFFTAGRCYTKFKN